MSVVVILLGINMSNFKIQVGWNKGGVGSTFISTLLSQHGVNCIESKDPLLTADLLLIPCNLDHLWAPAYGCGQFENQLTEFVRNCNAKHICFVPNKISRPNQWVEFESRLDVLMLKVGRSFNVSPPIYDKSKFSHWLGEGAQEPLIDPITDMFTSYILKLIEELGQNHDVMLSDSWHEIEDKNDLRRIYADSNGDSKTIYKSLKEKGRIFNLSELIAERNTASTKSKKTLTKKELIQLLNKYPDTAEIVLTVTQADIDSNPPVDIAGILVRELRLPSDHSYDADENCIALQVW